nr:MULTISPECIES: helix-turn-helix domain-containing protein [unclassified Haladaptatus]
MRSVGGVTARPADAEHTDPIGVDLPYEQRKALETAVEMGYYDDSESVHFAELSDQLGVPRSTFRYRLQRAEAWLATELVDDSLGFYT